jgi:hypothetical protein
MFLCVEEWTWLWVSRSLYMNCMVRDEVLSKHAKRELDIMERKKRK